MLTLNRPAARNALSRDLIRAAYAALTEADADEAVRAVMLTGADPAFCAGVDLKEAQRDGLKYFEEFRSQSCIAAVAKMRTPIVGAINGATFTGGLEMALGCDFLIASDRAVFADTHARVGILPGGGMTARLPQLVGLGMARRLSMTGEVVDAARAERIGLVTEVVAHERLLDRALELAGQIAEVPGPTMLGLKEIYTTGAAAVINPASGRRGEDRVRATSRFRGTRRPVPRRVRAQQAADRGSTEWAAGGRDCWTHAIGDGQDGAGNRGFPGNRAGDRTAIGRRRRVGAVQYGSTESASAATVAEIEAAGGDAYRGSRRRSPSTVMSTSCSPALREGPRGPAVWTFWSTMRRIATAEATIEAATREEFDREFAINVRAPFFITQRALPLIRDGGHIINISSGVTWFAQSAIVSPMSERPPRDVMGRALGASSRRNGGSPSRT